MKKINLLIELLIGLVLFSCDSNNEIEPVDEEWFPEIPNNIAGLNTVYDDYNSNLKRNGKGFDLYYSTNKESQGIDYDISCAHFDIFEYPPNKNVEFEVFKNQAPWADKILPVVNSDYNELGPFSFEWINGKNDTYGNWLFLYANDSTDDFNVNFVYININEWAQGGSNEKIYGPINSNVLNSASNDYYPTINRNHSQFYFCSDRAGDFDIFTVDISNPSLIDWLETGSDKATVCSIISSEYDDKCPYILGNLIVFSSNRKNGFGGFDLWYSVYENEEWSEPINFGPHINTEFDEYRPAIEYFKDSKNDLMIFSSNRAGGCGGFDLYYVGITKMTNK